MAKKRQTRVAAGAMTPQQSELFKAQLALQEKALEMARAQQERDLENRQRASQYENFGKLADLYRSRAGEAGKQYDVYAGDVESQRESALRQLSEAYGRGESGISSAQAELLNSLTGGQAYQNVPLLELGQIANPLLAGLAAEGASTAGVEQQSAQDAQINAQLAALARGAMGQLNVGEQNYMNALRNAGALSAAEARNMLIANQAAAGQSIRSEYDKLAQQIAQQRLADISDYEAKALEASGRQSEFAALPEVDYAAQLEAARKAALESIRSALPRVAQTTTKTTPTTPTKPTVAGKITGSGPISIPTLPPQMSAQQLKRKREAEDMAALRARGL